MRTPTNASADSVLSRRGSAWLALAIASSLYLLAGPVHAQVVNPDWWATNGTVSTIVRDGNTVYIGGTFTTIGPSTGGGLPVSTTTGALETPFSKVAGYVHAAVSDQSGGWYIGGDFKIVGGVSRTNLAHITAGGGVASWNPTANDPVTTLAVEGGTVYIGGSFTSISGQPRNHVAAIDATTGIVTGWNPGVDGAVYAIAVGTTSVFVGGSFVMLGGQQRPHLGAVDKFTGTVTPWNPNPDGQVNALIATGATVYAGGYFINIGGQERHGLAALDADGTGTATTWNPNPGDCYTYIDCCDFTCNTDCEYQVCPYVDAMALSGNALYVAGNFTTMGGPPRNLLAAVDVVSGAVTAWDPQPNGPVLRFAADLNTVYVSGQFSHIGGQDRRALAALDPATGLASAWNPAAAWNLFPQLRTIALSGTTLYAGGQFNSITGVVRANIAALDATTGVPTDWSPNANGAVNVLVVDGGTMYVGGQFSNIGGQTRSGIATLDISTGLATSWNPGAGGDNRSVDALAVDGNTIYAGGNFTSIGTYYRNYLAALDVSSGLATGWNPNPNGRVRTLLVDAGLVYAGGDFTAIGLGRAHVAAVDAVTGLTAAWNPQADGTVRNLVKSGSLFYMCGDFTHIGNQQRGRMAVVDATGAATAWNPNADGSVRALAMSDGVVYAGGSFGMVGGAPRSGVAVVDQASGALLPWDPAPNALGGGGVLVNGFAIDGTNVYVGGAFAAIGGQPQSNLAAITSAPVSVPPADGPLTLALAAITPNPIHSHGWIRYRLPSDDEVTLRVFDLTGRQVASLLDHVLEPAGPHEVKVDAAGWPAGCYYYQLIAGRESRAQKMVVLR